MNIIHQMNYFLSEFFALLFNWKWEIVQFILVISPPLEDNFVFLDD